MKKTVFTYGGFSGLIIATFMVISTAIICGNPDSDFGAESMIIGFAGIALAFSLIFFGTKNYRDKLNNGAITFGQAFKVGILITLISSTIYVLVWLVDYYCFFPDFIEQYSAKMLKAAKTPEEAQKINEDLSFTRAAYKTPIGIILLTYAEIFPWGLLLTLISTFVFKRKAKVS